MMFVFAGLGKQSGGSGWPVGLMYQTEVAFIAVAIGSLLCGALLRRMIPYQLFAVVGGIGAGFALVMPFELAPFFFGARGEIMMATALLILVYPLAIVAFILLFSKLLRPRGP